MTLSIEFTGPDGIAVRLPLAEFTDAAIEKAMADARRVAGELEMEPKTGLPSFTVFDGDEEIAGG